MKIDVSFDKAKLKKIDNTIKGSLPDIIKEAVKQITNSGRNETIKALKETVYDESTRRTLNKRIYYYLSGKRKTRRERVPTGRLLGSITTKITNTEGLVYIPSSKRASTKYNKSKPVRVVDYAYYLETGKNGITPRKFFETARVQLRKQVKPTIQRVLSDVLRKAGLI